VANIDVNDRSKRGTKKKRAARQGAVLWEGGWLRTDSEQQLWNWVGSWVGCLVDQSF